jgi:hypothetical protein
MRDVLVCVLLACGTVVIIGVSHGLCDIFAKEIDDGCF